MAATPAEIRQYLFDHAIRHLEKAPGPIPPARIHPADWATLRLDWKYGIDGPHPEGLQWQDVPVIVSPHHGLIGEKK